MKLKAPSSEYIKVVLEPKPDIDVYEGIRDLASGLRKSCKDIVVTYDDYQYPPVLYLSRECEYLEEKCSEVFEGIRSIGREKLSHRAYEVLVDWLIGKKLREHGFRKGRGEYYLPPSVQNAVEKVWENTFVRLVTTTDLIPKEGFYELYLWFDLKVSNTRKLSSIIREWFNKDVHELNDEEAREAAKRINRRYRGRECVVKTVYGAGYGTIVEAKQESTRNKVIEKRGMSMYDYLLKHHGELHPDKVLVYVSLSREKKPYPFVPCHVGVVVKRDVDRSPSARLEVLEAMWSSGLNKIVEEVWGELENVV